MKQRVQCQPGEGKPKFTATFTRGPLYRKVWDTCYPRMSQAGCTNFGNQKIGREWEWYTPGQVTVSGGLLKLTAQRTPTVGATANGTPREYGCRSGMVTSYPGIRFKYGFVQVVAKVPHATGLWPALWLAPTSGRFPPEIDMLESWGVKAETASFFHPIAARPVRGLIPVKFTTGWQTYSLSWSSRSADAAAVGRIHAARCVRPPVPHLTAVSSSSSSRPGWP